ncbi:MAG: hypothetical protein ABI467_19450 [Kofleriaceae bacterium]
MRAAILSLVWLVVCGAWAGCGGKKDSREAPAAHKPHITAMTGDDDRCDPAVPRICMGEDVVECGTDGHLGRRLRACHKGCSDGRCEQTCEDDNTKLIYLVSTNNDFLSFDPRKLPGDPFHRIGKLRCRAEGSPFSMSVDRNGTAWVLYGDGELFKVNINDARCQPTAFNPGATGSRTFGMGFSTDKAGGDSEKLYVADNNFTNQLSSIDTAHDLHPHRIGTLTAISDQDQNPELTGTSEGRLFGFYPSLTEPSFVQEINRSTAGPAGKKWPLGSTSLGAIDAYAFAQWGGVFYIFATISDPDTFEQNSTVRTVDRTTGKYRTIMTHIGYRISGAGVSTCAPERDASQQPQNPPNGP